MLSSVGACADAVESLALKNGIEKIAPSNLKNPQQMRIQLSIYFKYFCNYNIVIPSCCGQNLPLVNPRTYTG